MDENWEQDTVTSIVQTRNGYLWLGTYTGLVRFDGVRFFTFDSAKNPGLQNNRITSLYEDAGGVLWLGHSSLGFGMALLPTHPAGLLPLGLLLLLVLLTANCGLFPMAPWQFWSTGKFRHSVSVVRLQTNLFPPYFLLAMARCGF